MAVTDMSERKIGGPRSEGMTRRGLLPPGTLFSDSLIIFGGSKSQEDAEEGEKSGWTE